MIVALIPVIAAGAAVVGLGGVAYYRKAVLKKGNFTPERKKVFSEAMTNWRNPSKLKKLAKEFKKQGLNTQSKLLEMRANLRALPSEVKARREKIFRTALASTNPEVVKKVAQAFQKVGAVGAAAELNKYAAGLK